MVDATDLPVEQQDLDLGVEFGEGREVGRAELLHPLALVAADGAQMRSSASQFQPSRVISIAESATATCWMLVSKVASKYSS